MHINTKMIFLGFTPGTSKKTGASYMIAKMMDKATSDIYDFYIPGANDVLSSRVANAKQLTDVEVTLEMKAYQGKPQVDLADIVSNTLQSK